MVTVMLAEPCSVPSKIALLEVIVANTTKISSSSFSLSLTIVTFTCAVSPALEPTRKTIDEQ